MAHHGPNPSAPVFAQPCELRVSFPGGASGKEPTTTKEPGGLQFTGSSSGSELRVDFIYLKRRENQNQNIL